VGNERAPERNDTNAAGQGEPDLTSPASAKNAVAAVRHVDDVQLPAACQSDPTESGLQATGE
jgi:hypothetical protein